MGLVGDEERSGDTAVLLAVLIPSILLGGWLAMRLRSRPQPDEPVPEDFHLGRATPVEPAPAPPPPGAVFGIAPPEGPSPPVLADEPGDEGTPSVRAQPPAYYASSGQAAPRPEAARPSAPPRPAPGGRESAAEHEAKFLAAHGAEVREMHAKMGAVVDRYLAKSEALRGIDAEFGAMDRYMAVRRRFDQDGNPYRWARDALALPEVRASLLKNGVDPKVWRDAIPLLTDFLKIPKADALYNEATRFLTGDAAASSFVDQLSQTVTANLPSIVLQQGIPPGVDLGPIRKAIADATPQARR